MQNILSRIKTNNDTYSLVNVNCLEKPFGVIMDSYMKNSSRVFYMYLKLLQALNVGTEYKEEDIPLSLKIIDEKFSMKSRSFSPTGNLIELIKKEIDLERPVLAAGNLKEIFYSHHYMDSDAIHLFLIRGYDDEKKLFQIIDGTHVRAASLRTYSEFCMPYSMLEQSYLSAKAFAPKYEIISMEKKTDGPLVVPLDIAVECLTLLENRLDGAIFREDQVLAELKEAGLLDSGRVVIIKDNKMVNRFFNFLHFKEVFYNEIIDQCSSLLNDAELRERLSRQKETVINNWQYNINVISAALLRKKNVAVYELIDQSEKLERDLLASLVKQKSRLLEITGKDEAAAELRALWNLEFNEDKIITLKEAEVIFSFSGPKEYNSWITDEMPKALLPGTIKHEDDFFFKTRMTIESHNTMVNFHGGIVLKTRASEIFIWGNYSNYHLILEKMGVNSSYKTCPINNNCVILGVEKKDDVYIFTYSSDENEEPVEAYRVTLQNSVLEIGTGCKTWETSDGLKIVFDGFQNIMKPQTNQLKRE